MQELLPEIMIAPGPSLGSTLDPPDAVWGTADTGHREVKRGMTSPPPVYCGVGKKVAPVWVKEVPAKLKRERKADIRPRKKQTPPFVNDIKGEANARDIIDMPSGKMIATGPSRRAPSRVEKAT